MHLQVDSPRRLAKPHPDLITSLKDGRAIAIVGSGLSIDAGGPTWDEIVCCVAAETLELFPDATKRVAAALHLRQEGRLTDAAHELKRILGMSFYGAIVRQLANSRDVDVDAEAVRESAKGTVDRPLFKRVGLPARRNMVCTAQHRILMRLGFAHILTTNYDMLLEDSVRDLGNVDSRSRSDQHISARIQEGKALLLKLHGDVQHPEDIVLSTDDYATAMHEDKHRASVRSLLRTMRSFWIGCGHRDRNLDFLLDETTRSSFLSGGVALGVLGEPYLETRFHEARIVPAWAASYAEIQWYVRELAEAVGTPIVAELTLENGAVAELDVRARQFALELSSMTQGRLSLSPWRVNAVSGVAEYDVETAAWHELLSRVQANESDILRLCQKHAVVRVGWFEVALGKLPSRPTPSSALTEIDERTAIVYARGEFDTFYIPHFMHTIAHLSSSGVQLVAVNMRFVRFLNSTALGGLIKSSKDCTEKGVRLVIVRPSVFARDIMEKVGLDRIIPTYPSEEDAIEALGAAAPRMTKAGHVSIDDPAAVLWIPATLDAVARRNAAVNAHAGDAEYWIGKMRELSESGVTFSWTGSPKRIAAIAEFIQPGLGLNLRFRIPLSKRVCEAAATIITSSTEANAGVVVSVAFVTISDDDREVCRQFAADMSYLKHALNEPAHHTGADGAGKAK